MTISEPMTLFTDSLLAGVVFYFALRLQGLWRAGRQLSVRLWAGAFFASSLAAASGGTYHGFRPALGETGAFLLWKITVAAIGLTGLLMVCSMAMAVLRGRGRRALVGLAFLQYLLYLGWMGGHDAFLYVILDYVPALLCVLFLQLYDGWRVGAPAAPWLAGGVVMSFAAAAIQASGFTLHPHFNHNDLYHVVQLGAFYLLYRGGALLADRRDDLGVRNGEGRA
ncbi:hypothetical protein DSOUD_1505 [Desulfuromonas soudanensis]|uniref:Uncharacterized protein n=1 Tax=Desulfuromonas soudanensis TaxID=1603606 RepID=A0A0M4D0W4_9BACT|nr:hypothetical protein [Desulfuromonas soudanensis]ALC16284.1 hypothetical protein DSOUD_1505 [Desulfuromonas soudanensis]